MIELVRSNDPVFLSWLLAALQHEGIEVLVLDAFTSAAEGSISAIPRRVVVAEDDAIRARRVLELADELGKDAALSSETDAGEVTRDALLGGRVWLDQPKRGFRAAIDPVFLAAAVPAVAGESALDAGSGTGAAALCLAARVPGVRVLGLEIDPALARLARTNASLTDVADRVGFVAGDLLSPSAELAGTRFDHVLTNPPFSETGAGTPAPDPDKRRATVESAGGLAAWLDACLGLLKPQGTLTLIHRADRLGDALAWASGRAGGIVVFPLWPGVGKAAKRVIVAARKDSAAPLEIRPGLVLHGPGGAYTPEAEAILREGRALRF